MKDLTEDSLQLEKILGVFDVVVTDFGHVETTFTVFIQSSELTCPQYISYDHYFNM